MNEDAKTYFQAVEQHFIERRGQALLLSPEDVRRVGLWHDEGVPVEAVCEGIDVHFERMARRGRPARRAVTLAYCEDDVHEAWAGVKQRKLGARGGDGPADGEPSPLEEHARLLAALRVSAERAEAGGAALQAKAIGRAADKLETKAGLFDEGAADHDAQRTEDHLRRLERSLDKALREAEGDEALGRLVRAVESELEAKRARMKPEVYERVRDQLVAKRLRERFGLPRLSLFYT